jgi:hypothetical protein
MTDRIEVRRADLVAHAGHVEAIADHVATAGRAAATTRAGAEAYGKLCAVVPTMLNALQDVLLDGIASAAESLHDTGDRLRTTAQDYHAADERRGSAFRAVAPPPPRS